MTDRAQFQATLAVTIGFLAVHVVLAVAVGLVDDEAYYALWATRPDWAYYDHPGMVAWGIAAGRWAFGDTALAVRAASLLFFGGVSLLTWRIGYLAGGARVGFRAALAVNLMLPVLVLGFVAVPDAPSTLFWCMTLWALAEALHRPDRSLVWFALAGLAAGLGVQSKFTNLFMGVGLLAWAFFSVEGRRALRAVPLWLAGLLALAVMVPLVLWNAAHDWVGLERQFGRVGSGSGGWQTLLAYMGGMWLLVGVIFAPLATRGLRVAGNIVPLLVLTSAPLVLFMAWQSLGDMIQPNWLTPVFPAIAVLVALGAEGVGAKLWRLGVSLCALVGAVVVAVFFWPGAPLIPGNGTPNQMRGWAPVREQIISRAQETGAVWIATSHYGMTGQMAWRLQVRWPVWDVTEPNRYIFRGPMPKALCNAPALLVEDARQPSAMARFTSNGPATTITRSQGGVDIASYRLTPVVGLIGCDD